MAAHVLARILHEGGPEWLGYSFTFNGLIARWLLQAMIQHVLFARLKNPGVASRTIPLPTALRSPAPLGGPAIPSLVCPFVGGKLHPSFPFTRLTHSDYYGSADDRPICLARFPMHRESLTQYPGQEPRFRSAHGVVIEPRHRGACRRATKRACRQCLGLVDPVADSRGLVAGSHRALPKTVFNVHRQRLRTARSNCS